MAGVLTSNRSLFRTRPTSRTRANGSTQPSNRCGKTSSLPNFPTARSGKTNQERMEDPMKREKSAVSRRNFLKQGAAVGLGLLAGGRVKGSAWAASKERITILSSSVTDTLNPYNHSGSLIYGMWQHIYEPLVEVSYNPVRYTGALAESWEFQGKNCNDVVEMQAPDDHTAIFFLKRANALFLDRVENRFIISKAAADKYGDEMDQHGIGTGPYKFVSFQRGGNFVMTRNDDYWGAKAEIKEVIFKKVTEDAARVAALESGQADVINNVPVHDVPRLERNPRGRVEKVEGLRMFFLALNPAFKPFDNKL